MPRPSGTRHTPPRASRSALQPVTGAPNRWSAPWVGRIGRRLYRQRRDSVQDPAAGPLLAITAVTLLAAALAAALVIAGKPA